MTDDLLWETAVESHFRLGIAVHRTECLLATLIETIQSTPCDSTCDLVDTALLGCTDSGARLPTQIVVAFGLTFAAITLWHDLGFEDVAVSSLLCNTVMQRRCQASRYAILHGEWLAEDDMKAIAEDFGSHLDWTSAVINAMRSYLRHFEHANFSRCFS